jgi:hypothetical protein
MWATFENCNKLTEVSNRKMDENSHNLITLITYKDFLHT